MRAVAHLRDEQVIVRRTPVATPRAAAHPLAPAVLRSPAALLQIQRSAGNHAVGALRSTQPVQRCGETPADECPCHDSDSPAAASGGLPMHDPAVGATGRPVLQGLQDEVQRSADPAARPRASRQMPLVVQRAEPVSGLAAVAWCLSGAATTLALDLIANNLDAIFSRVGRAISAAGETIADIPRAAPMVAGPTLALGAGGGFRGLMERDRARNRAIMEGRAAPPRRRRRPTLASWKFNKCSALISVLVGCVFGVIGGAIRAYLIQLGKWTGRGLLEMIKKAGYEQAAGKWGLVIAKMGCLDRKLDNVQPKSATEAKPALSDLIEAAEDEGGICLPEPEPVASEPEPEELVCRAD